MTKYFRVITAWAVVLLASLSVNASARQVAAPAVQATALAKPALWKIADADTTIYLFGTIHALPKGVHWFAGPVASAFEASDELVTEIAGETDSAKVQALTASLALLPKDQSLRTGLSDSERAAFEKALAFNGLPAGAYDRFKPWFAAVALSNLPLARAGYDPASGVEATLDTRAKALKRPHIGLETAEYQLSLFDGLPAATQKTYLNEVVKHTPKIAAELIAIVEEWKHGDAEKLAELLNAEEDDPVMVEVLLTGRNRTWTQWIKGRMDKPGKVFLAVGAGHMAGRGSVLEQLETHGFAVTRLQ